MTKTQSDFPKDLEKGCRYEGKMYRWYKANNPHKNITWLQEKFEADFLINDFKVELKTDFTEHSNFFIEYYSNIHTERTGGPWQASKYNAKYFCYWFVNPDNKYQWNCYSFVLKDLLEWLSVNKNGFQTRRKENKGYQTLGIIIPIDILSKQSFCTARIVEVK